MLINNNISRGDTLIEVLFAISIFSLVAVGGLAIMNQGTATSQRALEITLVRNEIDAQAETLRFLNASYIAAYQPGISYPPNTPAGQWATMLSGTTSDTQISDFGITDDSKCPAIPSGSFILNARSATFIPYAEDKLRPAQVYSKVQYDNSDVVSSAQGIWIEAVRSATVLENNQANAGYVDFHIRACWDSPGQSVPVTIGTIVRLYEPRG
ncbi:MAG TPA: prepilin-type N-terminal cleavage/methylation domain-containing protein [Candidatus Angelobacter sp.]|nr:prepilin-type N-terminal cleavage/methylation domain-containing protein [Candidatus Angelobacter sp.]